MPDRRPTVRARIAGLPGTEGHPVRRADPETRERHMLEKTEGVYPPLAEVQASALVNEAQYQEMYARSIADPDGFWGEAARDRLDW
ncbi:acetyl-coenzyme A synthetase N-terminal domain-containing protein, partial [Poseidonocella sp. HB161398]|uniref:acetyl-coenzyme A synthetase N-terminal domain-containing protein n=1 Tax=Poseidonocella sp. HB161398 TaxID=2320855 RepID=UPI0035153346